MVHGYRLPYSETNPHEIQLGSVAAKDEVSMGVFFGAVQLKKRKSLSKCLDEMWIIWEIWKYHWRDLEIVLQACSTMNKSEPSSLINGNFRILKWRYCYKAIFWGYITLHRPYIGLIYGRYLHFRILKWPLILEEPTTCINDRPWINLHLYIPRKAALYWENLFSK